jgi:hypothetical protein
MRRLAALLVITLAACATERPRPAESGRPAAPPPGRGSGGAEAEVDVAAVEAVARAAAALKAEGFSLVGPVTPGRLLEARSGPVVDEAWAVCPRIVVRDPFAEAFRATSVNATEVRSTVTVFTTAASASATQVVVRASHVGTYLNSFTNNPEEAACRSTGLLEAEVVDAIRRG